MSQKELAILDAQIAALAASDAHQPMSLKQWLAQATALFADDLCRLAPRSWWREKHKAGASPLQAVQAGERYARLRRERARVSLTQNQEAQGA